MKNTLTIRVIAALAALTLFCAAPVAQAAEKKPAEKKPAASKQAGAAPAEKVAVVNGTAVSRAEFDRELNRVQRQLINNGRAIDTVTLKELQTGVLDSLIGRELLYQESKKKGIRAADADVNKEMEAFRKQFADDTAYRDTLIAMNLSEEDIRLQIEKGMTIQKYIEKEYLEKVTVTDTELMTAYERNVNAFKQPEVVRASHILSAVDANAPKAKKDEARKKIDGVRDRLNRGGDFEKIARESSDCPSKEKGGDLGYFRRGQMVKPFEDSAFALKTGQTSGIVETPLGFHIIKTTDHKPETILSYEQVKDNLRQLIRQDRAQKEAGDYIKKLREKAKVEILLPSA
jgi:peptidyl-prolyl cis-trans isomerase C